MTPLAELDDVPGFSVPVQELWRGELRLVIRPRDGCSVAAEQFHRGALRVLRPIYLDATGQVTYVIVNPGGGYLDGDRYRIDVTVADGGDLLLTTQSATKVYRTPRDRAAQQVDIRLGPNARLEYLPDQLIAYRDSRYSQDIRVEMDPSAGLVLSEVVTPGWSPSGEPFRYQELRLRTTVTMDRWPVVIDNIRLDPAGSHAALSGRFLEGRTHVGSLLVVDPRMTPAVLEATRSQLAECAPEMLGGVSALPVPGFALRVLGCSTDEVGRLLLAVVDDLRARWAGQPALNLRKY